MYDHYYFLHSFMWEIKLNQHVINNADYKFICIYNF